MLRRINLCRFTWVRALLVIILLGAGQLIFQSLIASAKAQDSADQHSQTIWSLDNSPEKDLSESETDSEASDFSQNVLAKKMVAALPPIAWGGLLTRFASVDAAVRHFLFVASRDTACRPAQRVYLLFHRLVFYE